MLPTKYISPQGLPIFLKLLATSLRTKLKKSLLKRQVLFFFPTPQHCIGFAIYQKESATGIHVVPILNPPPSSLPIPTPWVVPVHQPQASSIMHRTWTGDSKKKKKKQVLIQGAVHWGKFSSQQQLQALDLRLKAMGFRQVNLGRHKAMRNISISHKSFFFFLSMHVFLLPQLRRQLRAYHSWVRERPFVRMQQET